MTVDRGLQIHLTHVLKVPNEEGIHGNQISGMAGLDMPFAEFRTEALQQRVG